MVCGCLLHDVGVSVMMSSVTHTLSAVYEQLLICSSRRRDPANAEGYKSNAASFRSETLSGVRWKLVGKSITQSSPS
jgi:hypothetical protein